MRKEDMHTIFTDGPITYYLEDEISDVRLGPIEQLNGTLVETFFFKLRGEPFKASQAGRIRDMCLGHSEQWDRCIAVMAIADGLASPL